LSARNNGRASQSGEGIKQQHATGVGLDQLRPFVKATWRTERQRAIGPRKGIA
jgi:hypothetical protein